MSFKGWEGDIRVGTSSDLSGESNEAKIQTVRIRHGPSLEALYQIGDRDPQEIKEGNIDISLDIDIHYVSGSAWVTRAGVGSTGAHTTYYVGVYPAGYASGNPEILLQGKFNDWSLDVAQDGTLTESVSFVGKTIAVSTVS